MIHRCKPDSPHRAAYADRGIAVCDEWMDFETFKRDMGLPPTDTHTVDRIDNDKGYYKENCRWATQSQQCRNQRSNHIVQYRGQKMTIAELAERLGERQNTIYYKLKRGWTMREIEQGYRELPSRSVVKQNIQRIIELRKDGKTYAEIGAIFNTDGSNISRELCKRGMRTLKNREKKHTQTKEERNGNATK